MLPATASVAADDEREHDDRDDGQEPRERRAGVIGPPRSVSRPARSPASRAARFTSRWISGIRNRSHADAEGQAQARVHARAAAVRPADRHDRVAVAAPADEEDQLHVEHDARDLLAGEDVAGDVAVEALEPALRVLDGADDPQRRERVERLAQRPPPARLRGAHVGAVGLDPGAVRGIGGLERLDRSGSSSGGVAMSASANTMRSPVAWSMPARTAAPLPPWGTVSSSSSPATLGPGADEGRGAVGDPSSTTRTWSRGQLPAGPAVAGVRPAPVQVAEQLVEGRAEPRLLVVGGQHDGQRCAGIAAV